MGGWWGRGLERKGAMIMLHGGVRGEGGWRGGGL